MEITRTRNSANPLSLSDLRKHTSIVLTATTLAFASAANATYTSGDSIYINYHNQAMTWSNAGVARFGGSIGIHESVLAGLSDGTHDLGTDAFHVKNAYVRFGSGMIGQHTVVPGSKITVVKNGSNVEIVDFNVNFKHGDEVFSLNGGDTTPHWAFLEEGGDCPSFETFDQRAGGGPQGCFARGDLSYEISDTAFSGPAPEPGMTEVPKKEIELEVEFSGNFHIDADGKGFVELTYLGYPSISPDHEAAMADNLWFSNLVYDVHTNIGNFSNDGWNLYGDMFSLKDLFNSLDNTVNTCNASAFCSWHTGVESGHTYEAHWGYARIRLDLQALASLTGNPLTALFSGLGSLGVPSLSGSFSGFHNYYTVNWPVPEPATLWLMGTGLVGLGFVRRRRRIDAAANESTA